jgi:hypothetical protein
MLPYFSNIYVFLVSVLLTLTVLNSLINAVPVPEIRTDIEPDLNADKNAPPGVVQKVNVWLGEKKKSEVLKDILEVATMIKNMKKNKKKISSNYLLSLLKDNQWPKLSVNPIILIF